MSSATPTSGATAASGDLDEVIKLRCPVCDTGLNLRRKHLGVAGKCVKCLTPVMAREMAGGVVLARLDEPESAPEPVKEVEPASQPEQVTEPSPVAEDLSPVDDTVSQQSELAQLSDEPSTSKFEWPAPEEAPVRKAEIEPVAEGEDFQRPVVDVVDKVPAKKDQESMWGFPERDEDSTASSEKIEQVEESPMDFDLPESPASFDEFGTSELTALFGDASEAAPAAERKAEPESAESGDDVSAEESPASPFTNFASPFDDDMGMATSSLFSNAPTAQKPAEPETAASESETDGGVSTGWGTKVPTQSHASISPFSTGSAEEESPGFAEALFRGKASESQSFEPKSPFASPSEDGPSGGALFAAPAKKEAKKADAPESTEEEVVLDGDGRPLRAMTDEEKEQFAQDMMKYGGYHQKSKWAKRIRKFFITTALLIGVGYGTYVFLPREVAKGWKNKTLEWLEPGFSALEFLPVEIVEVEGGEPGEKQIKVKAAEQLQEFSGKFDAYLDQADQNLRDSGATMPDEREKAPLPEMPKLPDLPFKLPGGVKLDVPGQGGEAEAGAAEAGAAKAE